MVLVWNVNNRFLSVLSRGGRMKVFIVMDTTENTGRESIIGVFESLEKAKIALADYVLNTENDSIQPYYVDIVEEEIE